MYIGIELGITGLFLFLTKKKNATARDPLEKIIN